LQKPARQQGLERQPSSTRYVPLGALPDSRASAPASLQKPARQQGLERQPSSTRYIPLGALPDSRASAPALNYKDDPVWELLARLGQREDEAEAGCGFEPADEWPAEFLKCLGAWTEDIPRPPARTVGSQKDPF